jgi:hypothetical protein
MRSWYSDTIRREAVELIAADQLGKASDFAVPAAAQRHEVERPAGDLVGQNRPPCAVSSAPPRIVRLSPYDALDLNSL